MGFPRTIAAKIICDLQNRQYFENQITPDVVNFFVIKDVEGVVHAKERRLSCFNIFGAFSFISAFLYWYMIPDMLKYIVARLLIKHVSEPVSRIQKQWVFFNARFKLVA